MNQANMKMAKLYGILGANRFVVINAGIPEYHFMYQRED